MPPTRTKYQIEHDRAVVMRYRLQGHTLNEIADLTGNTWSMVKGDWEAVRKVWQTQKAEDLDEARQKELAKLDVVELEHWKAWDKSSKAVHLDGVLKCIAQRSRILGLNVPDVALIPVDGSPRHQTNVLQVFGGEASAEALEAANEQALVMLQEINDTHRVAGIGHYRGRPLLGGFEELEVEGIV